MIGTRTAGLISNPSSPYTIQLTLYSVLCLTRIYIARPFLFSTEAVSVRRSAILIFFRDQTRHDDACVCFFCVCGITWPVCFSDMQNSNFSCTTNKLT